MLILPISSALIICYKGKTVKWLCVSNLVGGFQKYIFPSRPYQVLATIIFIYSRHPVYGVYFSLLQIKPFNDSSNLLTMPIPFNERYNSPSRGVHFLTIRVKNTKKHCLSNANLPLKAEKPGITRLFMFFNCIKD